MSTVLEGLPDLDADAGSGIVARRAVLRWAARLFRREWRQQLLVLGLVSGTYPASPGQVALTTQVAARYGAHAGGTWQAAGTTWQVSGIVQDPSKLADEFALVTPGQIQHPSQVIMLLGPAAAQELLSDQTVPGVPAATVSVPTQQVSGVSQAVLILVVEVLGLAFIGLVSVASFSVMAQRRLRALGMAGAVIAGMAWAHRGLTATAGGVPPSDLLILLIGLPLAAAIGGWLFAGREQPAVARQPLE